MEFVTSRLTHPPLILLVSFELHLSPLHILLGGESAPDVEPGNLVDIVSGVEHLHPLVDPLHLLSPIPIARGWSPIVWVPDKFRCR